MSNNNKSNLKIAFKLKESVTAPLVREGVSNDSELKHFHTFRFFKINSRLVFSSVCEDSDALKIKVNSRLVFSSVYVDSDALKIGKIYDYVQRFADAGSGLVNLEIKYKAPTAKKSSKLEKKVRLTFQFYSEIKDSLCDRLFGMNSVDVSAEVLKSLFSKEFEHILVKTLAGLSRKTLRKINFIQHTLEHKHNKYNSYNTNSTTIYYSRKFGGLDLENGRLVAKHGSEDPMLELNVYAATHVGYSVENATQPVIGVADQINLHVVLRVSNNAQERVDTDTLVSKYNNTTLIEIIEKV